MEHGGRDLSGTFVQRDTAFSKRVAEIQLAVDRGARIEFLYRKPGEDHFEKRTIRPVGLESVSHKHDSGFTLCVAGYCELRKSERKFALARMKRLRII